MICRIAYQSIACESDSNLGTLFACPSLTSNRTWELDLRDTGSGEIPECFSLCSTKLGEKVPKTH